MKQSISPAIIGIAVVIVVAIVAFIGFKFFGPEANGGDAEYAKKYGSNQKTYSRDNPPPGVTVPANGSGNQGSMGGGGYRPPAGANIPGH